MIYAIIADIHGNLPALKAVVADARARGARSFLLLGDYIRDTPAANEVLELIQDLPGCTAILGNGDLGVVSLDQTRPASCSFDQMQPTYWTYKTLTQENLAFLKSLPETASLRLLGGKTVFLSHSISLIHHSPRLGAFHSGDYARQMEKAPFSLAQGMAKMLLAAQMHSHEVGAYPGDICLFGHNHLQFQGLVAGKLLLNPGSCGMAADYDLKAPYALLFDRGDRLEVELHRVEYPREETIRLLLEFSAFPYAGFWGRLRAALVKTGSDIPMSRFWQHARQIWPGAMPMPNHVWQEAVESFVFDHNWDLADWKELGRKLDMAAGS